MIIQTTKKIVVKVECVRKKGRKEGREGGRKGEEEGERIIVKSDLYTLIIFNNVYI